MKTAKTLRDGNKVTLDNLKRRYTPKYRVETKPEVYSVRSLRNTLKALQFFYNNPVDKYTARQIGVPASNLKYLVEANILTCSHTTEVTCKTYQNVYDPNDVITLNRRTQVYAFKNNCDDKTLLEMIEWIKDETYSCFI